MRKVAIPTMFIQQTDNIQHVLAFYSIKSRGYGKLSMWQLLFVNAMEIEVGN